MPLKGGHRVPQLLLLLFCTTGGPCTVFYLPGKVWGQNKTRVYIHTQALSLAIVCKLTSSDSDPWESALDRSGSSRCGPTADLCTRGCQAGTLLSCVPLPTEQQRHWIKFKRCGKKQPLPQELSPGSLPLVMNCRGTPLRGVRTISIKHNFLMKRSRGSPVKLIRMKCSLQPL